jgi:atypical dual specificity phosphatase
LRAAVGCEDYFQEDETYDYLSFDLYDDEQEYILPVLTECFRFIDAKTNTNKNILVHCHLGKSRSSTIVIAYFMLKAQFSF